MVGIDTGLDIYRYRTMFLHRTPLPFTKLVADVVRQCCSLNNAVETTYGEKEAELLNLNNVG